MQGRTLNDSERARTRHTQINMESLVSDAGNQRDLPAAGLQTGRELVIADPSLTTVRNLQRLEQERLEQERLEQERLDRERLEQGRLEQERLERERLERKKLQESFAQKLREQEKLDQEKREQEQKKREQESHRLPDILTLRDDLASPDRAGL